jgi:hypothetical protein
MADPTFEMRLRSRLRDVLDTETGPHGRWTDAPAARRIVARPRRGRLPLRLLAVAAVLAIGTGALMEAGSPRPGVDDSPPSPSPSAAATPPAVPPILRGQFVAQLGRAPGGGMDYPFYFLDLEDAVLVHGPSTSDRIAAIRAENGTAAEWAGRIVEFTPMASDSATVVIQAPPPCGVGRYVVRFNITERKGDAEPWSLAFTDPQDQCADRVAILVRDSGAVTPLPSASPDGSAAPVSTATSRSWRHQPTELVAGDRYSSWSFTEPFHFLVPLASPQAEQGPAASAWTWLAPGRLRIGSVWWRGEFLDDQALPADRCDAAAGSLPDIPSSPAAFEAWLGSNRRSIDESVQIEVDGRTATRYTTSESNCPKEQPNTAGNRWYLIPTGDDTILFNVRGDTETEYQLADDLVRSMTFD